MTIPLRLCCLSKVRVAVPAFCDENEVVTPEICKPSFKSFNTLSAVSLVRLFLRSLVTTLPTGDLLAKVLDAAGLSCMLSLSSWGYKSSTF